MASMRSRPARGRPTWWVVLAVSLALMALIAATAARTGRSAGGPLLPHRDAVSSTTTTSHPGSASVPTSVTTPVSTPSFAGGSTAAAISHTPAITTTSVPVAPSTTTTAGGPPPTGSTYPGYLQPPQTSSTIYAFSGQGPTRISVTWSGATYLTMSVTCSGFNQSTGGSSAMSMSIPNAQGACQAAVSEPTTENDTLSYTIAIDPTGG
jgi:hypothetical protein